jgi:hypothetical protein
VRRCIIHIGHAKTATTYLQHCLHLNADLFARHNYWVPSEFSRFGFYDLAPLAQAGAVISGNLAPLHERMSIGPQEQIALMHAYLFTAPGMPEECDILLSCELFFYYVNALALVVQAAEDYGLTVEIVAYLPRQDRGAVSAYLQNVRFSGFAGGVIDFLLHDRNIPYCDYMGTLFRLLEKKPDLPIRLRTFYPAFLRDGDVLTDFLATIGCRVHASDCVRPRRISNQGLTLEHYELLRAAALLRKPAAAALLRDDEIDLTGAERERTTAHYYRPYVSSFVADHFSESNKALLDRLMPEAGEVERRFWTTFDKGAETPAALDMERLENLWQRAFG